MTNNKTKLSAAIVHTICPVCMKEMDNIIVMNRILTKKYADEVDNMNGKAIFNSEPCNECKENMKRGVYIIEVEDGSHGKENPNMYRTGRLYLIRDEAIRNLFGDDHPSLETRVAFIEESDAKMIGLHNFTGD